MLSSFLSYLTYWIRSIGLHGIHSPFVYDFYEKVILNTESNPYNKAIAALQKKLAKDSSIIEVTDLGAGSKKINRSTKKISKIIRYSSKKEKYYEILSSIIQHYSYSQILELGTSLGIGTAYLGASNLQGSVFTFEGCPNLLQKAKINLASIDLENIHFRMGNIDNTLPDFLSQLNQKLDFVYIDANHTQEATLRYFELIYPNLHENSCLVFDDIYWSKGMTEAWNALKRDNRIVLTLDIYEMGIVFFNQKLTKQDFQLRV
ncbi:MAG: O-methyltransferase [Leadbetterella sp.]